MKRYSLGKLGNRLLSAIIISAFVIVVLVIASVISIRVFLNANVQDQQALDRIETAMNNLSKALIDQETGQRGYNLTGDVGFLEPYYQGLQAFSKNSNTLRKEIYSFPALHSDMQLVIQQGQNWQKNYGDKLVNMVLKGEQPSNSLLNEAKTAIDDFRRATDTFSHDIKKQRDAVRSKMQISINITLVSLVVFLIGIVLMNVIINFRLLQSVIAPIIKLNNCVKSYTEHDFTKQTPVYQKKDELFQLIENVDLMRLELSDSITSLELKVNYDELTGLYNRRYFNEFISKEWEEAKARSESLTLILFDIDHYKNFNDTYGHLIGDECLQKISNCLQSYNELPNQFVARYGGEEFAVLLLQKTADEIVAIAENIRSSISQLKIPHIASTVASYVTVSLGVATIIPEGNMMPNELISKADAALYQSKQDGRNKVTQYA